MGGYKNRILRVNLTDQVLSEEQPARGLIHDFVGGRGMGVKMLYDDLVPGVDPLGPDNELVFLAGPLAGTGAMSFHRWKVFFKSPLTGGYFKSSGGGRWASELKFAGFDGIIIKGLSEKPVYLWVHEGEYELRDATHLWGLDCDDTHELIREELRDPLIRLACIGPAGENQVKYAGIFTDRRTAGRGGGGAVMGAKNLKAIALRGKGKVEVGEPDAFKEASTQWVEAIRTNRDYEYFSETGTQGNVDLTNALGMFPVKNFRAGTMPGYQKFGGETFAKMRVRKTACYGCILHCGSITKVSEGNYRGAWSEGPEYETIWGFSGPIYCADAGLTVAADHLCDELGLDTISAASSIAFAYELYEKGLISKSETGGLELTYGNAGPVLPLLEQIAFRRGFGDMLAEGTREMSRRVGKGSEAYAMQVKGLELPGYDPRGAKAHGLAMMTLDVGADHNSGYSFQELFGHRYRGRKIDRFTIEGKGEMTKWNVDYTAAQETGILCNFAASYLTFDMLAKLLAASTGISDFGDVNYLLLVGERITNLERLFNVREGFGRKDDVMPARITAETLNEGPTAGKMFEAGALLDDYYKERGWDLKTGIPTPATLNRLGLGFGLAQTKGAPDIKGANRC